MLNLFSTKNSRMSKQISALKKIEGKKVQAGWFESDRYGASGDKNVGESVARIARIQEFGATITRENSVIIIPARPFMRGAWTKFSSIKQEVQFKIASKIVAGELTAEQGLAQIGMSIEGCIVKSIKNGGWVKNADATIAAKGFDKPLIDTGHMWKTVNSKVI